jgi:hypothetical protein
MIMSTIKKMSASVLIAVLLTACGGGNSGDAVDPTPAPTPAPTITPEPPLYTGLKDLENKALNLKRNWEGGEVTSKTFKFTNHYIENTGKYNLLQDDLSSQDSISACMLPVEGVVDDYICMTVSAHGSATAYAISIDGNQNISGIFDYSLTGNTYELADGLYYDWLNDGYITGYTTINNTKNFNSDDVKLNKSVSDESEVQDTTNNAILQQAIDDVYHILLSKL